MSEVFDIPLTKVGTTFPVGTVVGLYAGIVPDSGVPRPVGAAIATATVLADESLTFAAVTAAQGTYWAAAQVGGVWRIIATTNRIGSIPKIGPQGNAGPTGATGAVGATGPAGLGWKGAWSNATAYVLNDAVTRAGSSYRCILAHTAHEPPNATYWEAIAEKGESPFVAVKTAAQELTKNSEVLQEVTGLALPVSASATERWIVEYFLLVEAVNAVMDLKIGFAGPAGATLDWGADSTWAAAVVASSPPAPLEIAGVLSAGSREGKYALRLLGLLKGGGTAGNLVLKAAQNTANASAELILQGSCIRATKTAA